MPIYEYECDDCEETFEVFAGINDAPVQECTNCTGKNIRKLISNCSFQLKGTGWYKTDYASKDSNASSNDKKASSGEKATTEKSESSSASSESNKTSKDKDSSKSSSEKAA